MQPGELVTALQQLPPREAQVLLHAVAGGSPLTELYGITEESADLLLYQAARQLAAQLSSNPPPPPGDFEDDRRQATALRLALSGAQSADPLAGAVLSLKGARDEVRARLAAAEAAAETSPERARESWIRFLAIAAILALTAYFYWKEAHKPLPPPQPRTPPPAHTQTKR